MADDYRIDPAVLRAQSPKFTGFGTELSTALTSLQQVIAAEGECWGHDKTGNAFGDGENGYKASAEKCVKRLGALVSEFPRIASGLTTVANKAEQRDAATQSAIQNAAVDL